MLVPVYIITYFNELNPNGLIWGYCRIKRQAHKIARDLVKCRMAKDSSVSPQTIELTDEQNAIIIKLGLIQL